MAISNEEKIYAKLVDAGAQIWDLRHERFAGGIPMDGVTDCRAAVQAAIDDPEVTRVFFPRGSFVYSGAASLVVTAAEAGMHFEGAGHEHTSLTYTPDVPADISDYERKAVIAFHGAEFGSVSGIRFKHTGSRCVARQKEPGVGFDDPVHGWGVEILDSNNVRVHHNYFDEGLHGVYVHSDDPEHAYYWSANQNIVIDHNEGGGQYNAGAYISHAYAPTVQHNFFHDTGYDGIKATGNNFMIDVCFNRCARCGRDGIDTYPAGKGAKIDYNRVWENSEYGMEVKGLYDPGIGQLDYGYRDGSCSGNRAWGNGGIESWSNPDALPRPNFSIVTVRGLVMDGNISILASGPGFDFTSCQELTVSNLKVIRPGMQGISFHSTSRVTLTNATVEDAGYVEGTTPVVGTHDGMTFAAGSSGIVVIGGGCNNSVFKPGATRYAATCDATSTGSVFDGFRATNTLTGTFAVGTSSVDADGIVTMSGPFDAGAAFDSQEIASYYGPTAYHGITHLLATRPGVRTNASNAEFALQRVGEGTLLLQVQATVLQMMGLGNYHLRLGSHGSGWLELDEAGHTYPLTGTQYHGSAAHPWARGYYLGTWQNPFFIGYNALWINTTSNLPYFKAGNAGTSTFAAPASDTDGTRLDPASLRALANTWDLAQTFTVPAVFGDATSPFTVAGTGQVNNLNANLLQGQLGAYYLALANATGTLAWGNVSKSGAVASDVGAVSSSALQFKHLSANVALSASTTVSLPEMDVAVANGDEWILHYRLKITVTGGTAGLTFRITHPGATGNVRAVGTTSGAATVVHSSVTTNVTSPITGATPYLTASFTGWVEYEVTLKFTASGTVSIGLNTGASAAGNVLGDSWLQATRLSP